MRLRVVCGLSETIASFWPTSRLRSVDLPALGRPTSATKPAFMPWLRPPSRGTGSRRLIRTRVMRRCCGIDDLHVEAVHFDVLAHGGHPAEARQQESADGLEALASIVDLHQLGHLVDVDAAAQQEFPIAFVDDAFDFDVVFVADLADDLFEQIFNGHQAGRAAVFVDDDRDLQRACAGTP